MQTSQKIQNGDIDSLCTAARKLAFVFNEPPELFLNVIKKVIPVRHFPTKVVVTMVDGDYALAWGNSMWAEPGEIKTGIAKVDFLKKKSGV